MENDKSISQNFDTRQAKKKRDREYSKRYRLLHLQWDKIRKKKYRACNAKVIAEKAKAYRRKHHMLVREQEKRSRENNNARYLSSQRKYNTSKLCRDTRRAYRKKVRSMLKIYKQNYRARKQSVGGSCKKEEMIELMAQDSCIQCGISLDLVIDHIIPVKLGGSSNAANLQILCRSCNSKKSASIVRKFITQEVADDYINMHRDIGMNSVVVKELEELGYL